MVTLIAVNLGALPYFVNFVNATKVGALLLGGIAMLGVYGFDIVKHRRISFVNQALVGPLAAMLVAVLASSFLANPYPVENLLTVGGSYLAFISLGLLGGTLLTNKTQTALFKTTIYTGAVVSVLAVLQALGVGPSRIINALSPINIPHDMSFLITGSPFITAQFLGVVLVGGLWHQLKSKTKSAAIWGTLGVVIVGLAITIFASLPGKTTSAPLVPYGAAWSIALDTLRSPRTALIGVGPSEYASAYQLFRPFWTNARPDWQVVYGQGSNAPLTLLPSMGLLMFGAWVWLLVASLKLGAKDKAGLSAMGVMFLASFLIQIIFPTNILILSLQAVTLAAWIAETRHGLFFMRTFALQISDKPDVPTKQTDSPALFGYAIGGAVLVSSLVVLYFFGRAYASSYFLYKSGVAAQEGNAVDVYESQRRAVALNPYLASTRRQYAVTNLQLAIALSNKTDATEEERQQVLQLIQQSVREARAATVIQPLNSQNWQTLAAIYSQLIDSAPDAEQFTVQAYTQAINTSPANPLLLIELGGLFYNAENYRQALSLFQQASNLKTDLPNTYYNLANTLVKLNELAAARVAYQQTLTLLPSDSEAYLQAAQEIEALEAQIKEQTPAEETDEAGEPTSQSTVPSLLDQTINQPDDAVVTDPGTQPLEETTQVTPTTTPSPAATASPAPAGN